jgi:hypothetical protein
MRAAHVRGQQRPVAKIAGFQNRPKHSASLTRIEAGFSVLHRELLVGDECG